MGPTRANDGAGTRQRILDAAFSEIHALGYHEASLERILASAGVTKGALYHHFASKTALAHALVEEFLGGRIRELDRMLRAADDPVAALRAWIEAPPQMPVELGCPLNNLAQEMATLDEPLREHIEQVFASWRAAIAGALARGQATGQIRDDVDPAATATFVLAALEGAVSLAKSARDPQLFESSMSILSRYIGDLGVPRERETYE